MPVSMGSNSLIQISCSPWQKSTQVRRMCEGASLVLLHSPPHPQQRQFWARYR